MPAERYLWLDRLTAPHPDVIRIADRRRARLAARLVVALVPFVVVTSAYLFAVGDVREGLGVGAAAIGVLVAYAAIRSRRPAWGEVGVVVAVWTAGIGIWLGEVVYGGTSNVGFTMVLPVFLGALLLEPRHAAIVASATVLVAATIAGTVVMESGSWNVVEVGLLLYLIGGSGVALMGSATLKRSLEDQETANLALAETDAQRRRLLAFVAHDIANPIQAIDMHLYVRRRRDADDGQIESIQRSLDQIKFLLQDVRDLARAEAGEVVVRPRKLPLREKILDAVRLVETRAAGYEMKVDVQVPAELAVRADPDRLDQVVVNLVTNALKFGAAGDTVTVSAHAVDDVARIAVQDQGRGLTADERARLFRPFVQVHKEGESRERGTGLGLVITKGIVEAHGGRIWVESEGLGKGSTFAFELPLAPPI